MSIQIKNQVLINVLEVLYKLLGFILSMLKNEEDV